MTPFAAIIFDLDGVIVDSEDLHVQAWWALFREIGLADRLQLRIEDYYGKSDRMFLRDLLAHHQLDQTAEELSSRKVDHLIRLLETDCPIFHGLHDLLPALSQRWPLAIASLSSHRMIDVVLERSGLRAFFRLVVGAEDIRFPKPDPEIYFTAARRLEVRPSTCCVIEDSPVGVQAAKMAGMTCIGLTTGQTADKLARADYIATDYTAVRRLLLEVK